MLIKEEAKVRASPSLLKYFSNVGFFIKGIFSIVLSTRSVMSRKTSRFLRKAKTAISLAAFKTQGKLPPLKRALVASVRFRKVLTSGSSKVRVFGFLKLYLGSLLGIR